VKQADYNKVTNLNERIKLLESIKSTLMRGQIPSLSTMENLDKEDRKNLYEDFAIMTDRQTKLLLKEIENV